MQLRKISPKVFITLSILIIIWLIIGTNRKESFPVINQTSMTSASDHIDLPANERSFFSREKRYVFTVTNDDRWSTPTVRGQLSEMSNNVSKPLWSKNLPQTYGPRHIIIGRDGEVLMLDEWINKPSDYAILLFSSQGNKVAQYKFDQIPPLVGKSPASVAESAKLGAWIASDPILEPEGNIVHLSVTGKQLRINLKTGRIVVQ